jgi:hypothetical protein
MFDYDSFSQRSQALSENFFPRGIIEQFSAGVFNE